jgi:DNA-binding transcriptional MerR regulator
MEEKLPDKLFFRIGEAAEVVGVEPHVLRYWESEFKLRPKRSSSGQRMYQREDLSKFLQIRTLLHDQGFTIAGARRSLLDGEPAAVSGNEHARLREVAQRLEGVRARLAEAKERVMSRGIAGLTPER